MRGLELFQFVQQAVECLVGDLGRVVDVVPLFVMANEVAQLSRAIGRRRVRHDSILPGNR